MNTNAEHVDAALQTLRFARSDALGEYRAAAARACAEYAAIAERLWLAEMEFAEAEQRAKGAA